MELIQEQQETIYYDRLLHHLNRIFQTNMRSQQLYLDLVKHPRTIKFKFIKNIYRTLTQGKADEVIYKKDKPQILGHNIFNLMCSQRTSWRVIQKLVSKISFFLANEHRLADFAPSIIKDINFVSSINSKITSHSVFAQYFADILDSVVAENNLLENKIYELLIRRGYIYSIDQFYRMNRFEGPNLDFVHSTFNHHQNQKNKENNTDSQQQNSEIMFRKLKSQKSRKALMSRKSINPGKMLVTEDEIEQNSSKQIQIKVQQGNQKNGQNSEPSIVEIEIAPNPNMVNKLMNNIHEQIEKVADQLLHNRHLQSFTTNFRQEDPAQKDPVIKQLLKNIKLQKFKANAKVLAVARHSIMSTQQKDRPKQKYLKKSKTNNLRSMNQKRTSLALAMNTRMKQTIFNNEVGDLQKLVITNLRLLEQSEKSSEKGSGSKRNGKKSERQRRESLQTDGNPNISRKSSNLKFLTNAFVFQNKPIAKSKLKTQRKNRQEQSVVAFKYVNRVSEGSRNETTKKDKNMVNCNKRQSKNSYRQSLQQNEDDRSKMIKKAEREEKVTQRVYRNQRFKMGQFNPTLLEIAAKKYNKYDTEADYMMSVLKDISNVGPQILLFNKKLSDDAGELKKRTKIEPYQHFKRCQIFDRCRRRLFHPV